MLARMQDRLGQIQTSQAQRQDSDYRRDTIKIGGDRCLVPFKSDARNIGSEEEKTSTRTRVAPRRQWADTGVRWRKDDGGCARHVSARSAKPQDRGVARLRHGHPRPTRPARHRIWSSDREGSWTWPLMGADQLTSDHRLCGSRPQDGAGQSVPDNASCQAENAAFSKAKLARDGVRNVERPAADERSSIADNNVGASAAAWIRDNQPRAHWKRAMSRNVRRGCSIVAGNHRLRVCGKRQA